MWLINFHWDIMHKQAEACWWNKLSNLERDKVYVRTLKMKKENLLSGNCEQSITWVLFGVPEMCDALLWWVGWRSLCMVPIHDSRDREPAASWLKNITRKVKASAGQPHLLLLGFVCVCVPVHMKKERERERKLFTVLCLLTVVTALLSWLWKNSSQRCLSSFPCDTACRRPM